jgi:phosphoglycerol transferase
MNRYVRVLMLGCCWSIIAGCGDNSQQKAQVTVTPGPPPTSGAAAAPAGKYDAKLADGIDFRKPGLPSFLAEMTGISVQEPWGRWSEGPLIQLRFTQPLPRKFTLELTANAFGPNNGQPVKVRVGAIEKTLVINSRPEIATYTLAFETPDNADTIQIIPPKPTSPSELDAKSSDTRKLAIAFVFLRIKG